MGSISGASNKGVQNLTMTNSCSCKDPTPSSPIHLLCFFATEGHHTIKASKVEALHGTRLELHPGRSEDAALIAISEQFESMTGSFSGVSSEIEHRGRRLREL